MAAATASLHFAPTDLAARFLLAVGVEPERVRVVGNPVIDVLRRLDIRRRPAHQRSGAVITAHRATNVDDPDRLALLVALVGRVADEVGPVTFPLHPRTRARLVEAGTLEALDRPGVTVLPPVPYPEMLGLLAGARVVLTDSGGLQEEAAWLGLPVVVLRRSTPRWEGVIGGTSALVGLDVDLAVAAAARLARSDEQFRVAAAACPYGDGRTGERVAGILADPATSPLLAIEEPDYVGKPPPVPGGCDGLLSRAG
jgi:UDP-N-acetylglucosamine 2-epimerase (non-hydrolysing)